MRARSRRTAVAGLAVVMALLGWWYVAGTPQYSLYSLVRAIHAGDQLAAEQYVNGERIAGSFVDGAMRETLAGVGDTSSAGAGLAIGMMALMRPMVREVARVALREAIRQAIEEDSLRELRMWPPKLYVAILQRVTVQYRGRVAHVTARNPKDETIMFLMMQKPDRSWEIVGLSEDWMREQMQRAGQSR